MLNSLVRIIILGSFLLLSGCGSHPPDFQTMLENLSRNYGPLWSMVTAAAYVLGFLFAFKAIYALKIYGEQRTYMSSSGNIKTPIIYLFVAAALIFTPSTFDVLMMSTFSYTSPLHYTGGSGHIWTSQGITAALELIQFLGLIAFIRGWLYIARASEQGGQQGTMGKGLTHIFGGILAINIVGTWEVLKNSFWG